LDFYPEDHLNSISGIQQPIPRLKHILLVYHNWSKAKYQQNPVHYNPELKPQESQTIGSSQEGERVPSIWKRTNFQECNDWTSK